MLKQIKRILNFKIGPSINYSKLNPKKYNWQKIKECSKVGVVIFALIFIILLNIDLVYSDFIDSDDKIAYEISQMVTDYIDENFILPKEKDDSNCNVEKINIHGYLSPRITPEDLDVDDVLLYDISSSEEIIKKIKQANKNKNVKVILLDVESNGGLPGATEEIEDAIKHSKKPVVAYIREAGVSAAYWVASAADYIISLANVDVGSIGITSSYTENSKKNQKEGITFHSLSIGKFKDTFNPDKPLTPEEKKIIMRDLKIINERFIDTVAKNRKMSKEEVRKIANGSSMVGSMALEYKLVDEIGTIYDVEDYIKGLIEEDVKICE